MTKFIVAVLAVSVSVLAVACGGSNEPAKTEGMPAGETTAPAGAMTSTPEAAPSDSAMPSTPPAEAPKH